MRILLIWLLFCAPASSQIDLSELYDLGKPIEARCACVVPEGAEIRVSWQVPSVVEAREHPSGQAALYMWAPAGTYRIGMTQIVDYPEILTILVPGPKTNEDPDGMKNPLVKEMRVFLRPSDYQQFDKTFQVVGEEKPDPKPDPNPDPKPGPKPNPPTPVGDPYFLIIIYESETSARQAGLYNELRQRLPGKIMAMYRFDKDDGATSSTAASWISHTQDDTLPVMLVANKAGKIIRKTPLPNTYSEIEGLVK